MKPPITNNDPEPLETARRHDVLTEILGRFDLDSEAILVQIPQVPFADLQQDVARNRGYFAYPPVGLLYLAATLAGQGIETRIVDLNFEELRAAQENPETIREVVLEALTRALQGLERPLVGVSFMFDATQVLVQDVCKHIRSVAAGAVIVAGGVAATADPEQLLDTNLVDLVVLNEGEGPIEDLIEYRRTGGDLPRNLCFRDPAGGPILRTTAGTGGAVEIDIRRQYEKIPIADYHSIGSLNSFSRLRGVEIPFATMLSRRGCRARCTFCAVRNFNGKAVRVRDRHGVVDEMKHLRDRHGIRHFDWLDDDLLWDPDDAIALFGEISERLPDITWAANNGLIASAVTPQILEAMDRSHCIGFTVGLESGNERVLHRIKKPTRLEQFFKFSRTMENFPRMFSGVHFILGFPEETFQEMLDSFQVAIRSRLDWTKYFTYQPLKNTDLYHAFGGLDAQVEAISAGEEGQRAEYTPARNRHIWSVGTGAEIAEGWDVIEVARDASPSRRQAVEIWFSFNYVTNFLRLPALTSGQEERVRNGIRWLRGLVQAFPDNPSMLCVLHYLTSRIADDSGSGRALLRERAVELFRTSQFWRERDREFSFSAFLDGEIPGLDPRWDTLLSSCLEPVPAASTGVSDAAHSQGVGR